MAGTLLPGRERQPIVNASEAGSRTKPQVTATGGTLGKRVDTPAHLSAAAITSISGVHSGGGPLTSPPPVPLTDLCATPSPWASADSIHDERQDHGQHLEVAERQVPAAIPG